MANLSKLKRDKMIAFLEQLKKTHSDDESIRAFNEIENQLLEKKYGLVWEEHSEDVDELLKENIPVFSADCERRICSDPSLPWNFIIEGDNLQALYLLEKTHKGKIDCIYIDPPYNTGAKTWKYNNNYVDDKDVFRHSKWISFMNQRLKIAHKLLAQDGVLVLTIDDYEVQNITMLLNEIFGEDNHIGTIVIKNNPQGRSSVTGFQISHEYALFYGKNKTKIKTLPRSEEQLSRYKENDEFGPFEWRNFRAQYSMESASMVYPIYIKKDLSDFRIPSLTWDEINKKYIINEQPKLDEIVSYPVDETGRMRTWKWGIETVLKAKKDHMGVRKDRGGNPAVYYKGRMKTLGMQPFTIWDDPRYSASTFGANILSEIIGKKKFDYPKSLYAVLDCIRVATDKKDAIVLDFFAGSGTTGHAVSLLNAYDNGSRKFILVTNNEISEKEEKELLSQNKHPGDEEWEKLGVAKNVTWPRIVSVISGKDVNNNNLKFEYIGDNGKTLPAKNGIKENLKYFKCEWTTRKPEDYLLSNMLCLHIKEMIELQNSLEVDNIKNVLILNKEDFNNTFKNANIYPNIKNTWVNQNIVFSSSDLRLLKTKKYKYIPREYFGQELKEVAE